MKAISLWQPWASLWLSPHKVHETRHWSIQVPKDGFWMAVHAAKRPMHRDDAGDFSEMLRNVFGTDWQKAVPYGALLGRVFITACISTNDSVPAKHCDDFWCGDFSPDRFAWRRTEYRRLTDPIPCVGRQGIFSVPEWSCELESNPQ